ncbi:MAG: hypothetical protein O3A99_09880 [Proteobacteria bacterium]|nr:hypothetical protein [Pseudomonadota bacterium]
MKTLADDSSSITQMATWKYVLYMGLTFTLLKVFYFYQTTSVTADVVSQFIAEYQPGSRLFNGDINPAAVLLSIAAGATAIAALLALFADLITIVTSTLRYIPCRFWIQSALQHGGIAAICGVICFALFV